MTTASVMRWAWRWRRDEHVAMMTNDEGGYQDTNIRSCWQCSGLPYLTILLLHLLYSDDHHDVRRVRRLR